jgi:hypothetical protein
MTCEHTEEQIDATIEAVAEGLAEIGDGGSVLAQAN